MEEISPPIDLLKLESLPFDLQRKLALELSPQTLFSFCKTSKKLKRVCEDLYFWRDYFKVQIPDKINILLDADINWYKDKIRNYSSVKKLAILIKSGGARAEYIQDFDNNWDIFEIIDNLRLLDCRGNKLTYLPPMPNLTWINCANNQLKTIPLMINLRIIYCQNNAIISLPSFPSLVDLYCSNNLLTSLPPMPNLVDFYCSNNLLTSIPSMPKLEVLRCNNNKLTSIPSMPELRVLRCNDNQITSIPSMPNLEQLDCFDNELTSIPYMPNLKILHCQDNPLPGFTLEYWKNVWSKQTKFL